jgi:hypothetical protein
MAYRRDPVPRTGRRSGNYYRNPKTTQERRWVMACPGLVRPRRRGKYLPTNWNDIPRTDAVDRCWKRSMKRRRQWMR